VEPDLGRLVSIIRIGELLSMFILKFKAEYLQL